MNHIFYFYYEHRVQICLDTLYIDQVKECRSRSRTDIEMLQHKEIHDNGCLKILARPYRTKIFIKKKSHVSDSSFQIYDATYINYIKILAVKASAANEAPFNLTVADFVPNVTSATTSVIVEVSKIVIA